jgi:hypothetical protein
MSSSNMPPSLQPVAPDSLPGHEIEAHDPEVTGHDLPNDAGLAAESPPVESLGGIKLLPDQKAQCVCGRVINRSSIYRHAIAGDGQCSGGSNLTEQDIAAMRDITFLAKASYMRNYREKTSRDRRSRSVVAVAGAPGRAGELSGGQPQVPMHKPGAMDSRQAALESEFRQDPSGFASGYFEDNEEETAECPAPECGRSVRARNLFEHVSSKTCKGGHRLSTVQLSGIKSIAKAARVKYKTARKARPLDSMDVSNPLCSDAMPLQHAAHAVGNEPNMLSFFSHQTEQQNVPGAPLSDTSLPFPNVLDMSIRDIAVVMARVVCRGHTDVEKKQLEAEIVDGVENYRLTALVLLAKKPSAEVCFLLNAILLCPKFLDGCRMACILT